MLVRVTKNKNNNNLWDITCLTSQYYGQIVATVEGVRLSNARFQTNSITGFIHALYGAQIDPGLEDIPDIVRALGLNQSFMTCHAVAMHDPVNSGWFDPHTLESLYEARYVNAMPTGVFYSHQSHIDEQREELARSVQVTEDLSATEHFKEGFKIIAHRIMGD